MIQVIRYVIQNDQNECEIIESFIKFVRVYNKTGESLTEDILDCLKKDNLRISDCRGQSFDNGSNMSGKIKGVQARIIEMNKLAKFIPCSAHSLNLIGVNCAKSIPKVETFFGIVQKLFNFFSSSTQRWDILMNNLKLSLKGYTSNLTSMEELPEDLNGNDLAHFKYAPITSLDVERSFSRYKNVLTDNHHSFEIENIKKVLVI
ncbi:hypothetical protein QTP88_011984 [Uroleucon formosanum]